MNHDAYLESELPEEAPICTDCDRPIQGEECQYCTDFPNWLRDLSAKISKVYHDSNECTIAAIERSTLEELIDALDKSAEEIDQ